MNAGKPYAMRVSTEENPAERGAICGKIGATQRSPSRVLGGPQLGLLATNQTYLKGA